MLADLRGHAQAGAATNYDALLRDVRRSEVLQARLNQLALDLQTAIDLGPPGFQAGGRLAKARVLTAGRAVVGYRENPVESEGFWSATLRMLNEAHEALLLATRAVEREAEQIS